MQRNLLRTATALAAVLATASAMAQIKWVTDYSTAVKQAKSSNKLVMVEFYAGWDLNGGTGPAWSARLEADTFQEDSVQKLSTKFVPVRLDVDKNGKALAAKYRITKYPTVLFLDKNGTDVGRIDGFEVAEEFTEHAETFLKDYNREAGLRAKLKKTPRDLDTLSALGVIEATRYKTAPAMAHLKQAESIDPSNKTGKLSDLYSAIGDIYQNDGDYDRAIAMFKKSANTSTKTKPKAYALLSVATCYMSKEGDFDINGAVSDTVKRTNVLRNLKLARPFVEQTLKLPGLSAEDRQIAERDLRDIKQILDSVDSDGNP